MEKSFMNRDVMEMIIENYSNGAEGNQYGMRISKTKNDEDLILFSYLNKESNNYKLHALKEDEYGDYEECGMCSATINDKEMIIDDIDAYETNIGIGSAMLRYFLFTSVENGFNKIKLDSTNDSNAHLYEKFGFDRVGYDLNGNSRRFKKMELEISGHDSEDYADDYEYEVSEEEVKRCSSNVFGR